MDKFNFQATAIGSLWQKDAKAATSLLLSVLPDIPCWPQLPQRSFKENMYVQFSEGIPGIVVTDEQRRIFVDAGNVKDEEIAKVYEKYLAEDLNAFSIGKEYASGFYEFLSRLKGKEAYWYYLKGHITGPISFLLTVTDENKKPLIYQSQLADCILKILTMKVRWQIKRLKGCSANVIIFVDEPYLVSIGSGYLTLNRQELIGSIDEVIEGIHREGALAGIHCCGNTDWEFITQTKSDIISFDAYEFSESLALYPEAVGRFLKRGGAIAWGIVPTGLDKDKISLKSLTAKLSSAIKLLTDKGIEKELILEHSLLSPSCGLGSLQGELGEFILKCTRQLAKIIKEKGI